MTMPDERTPSLLFGWELLIELLESDNMTTEQRSKAQWKRSFAATHLVMKSSNGPMNVQREMRVPEQRWRRKIPSIYVPSTCVRTLLTFKTLFFSMPPSNWRAKTAQAHLA